MCKILIVDDEATIILQLENYINSMGYSVAGIAGTGEESLEMAKKVKPDIILMDIVMPGNIDGIEATKKIKKELNIPVIFITSYTDEELVNRAKHVEPFGYIVKPFQESEVRAAVDVALFKKEIEKRLHESEEKYRTMVSTSKDAIVTIDSKGRIISWNNGAENIFGYKESESIGMPISNIIPENIPIVVESEIKAETVESTGVKKDGKTISIEHSNAGWKTEKGQFCTYNIRDITDRKKTEKMLRSYSSQLERTVSLRTHDLTLTIEKLVNEINERKHIEKQLLHSQKLLRHMTSELSISEEKERRRIATELHGSIGQNLSLAIIKCQELKSKISSEDSLTVIEYICDMLEQSLENTRLLALEISPPVLYEIGLEAAVSWLLEQFKDKHGLQYIFEDDKKQKSLDDNIRVLLFQAVRELLMNIIKHAGTDKAAVSMKKEKKVIKIVVEDSGRGFDSDNFTFKANKSGGYGLFSINERLRYLGGSMHIKSRQGKGTRITLEVPVRKTQ